MRDMTVDPGLNTGIAVWDNWSLIEHLVLRVNVKVRVVDSQLRQAFDLFRDILIGYRPDRVTIEGMQDFGSLKSQVAFQRGNLSKLAYIVGGYFALCSSRSIGCTIVDPTRWKGQLTEHALRLRIGRSLKGDFRQHELEAIGIGLYLQGRL